MNSVCCICISIELVVLLLSPLEELDSNLLEECQGEKVLGLLLIRSNSFLERLNFRSDLISGSIVDDIVITDDLLLELIGNGCRASSVFTANESLELLGYSGVQGACSRRVR